MSERVLVVAAHPDDEALGCGATLARHVAAGDRVDALFLTPGVGSRASSDAGEVQRRRSAARAAADTLGIASVTFGDFPDNRLDAVDLLDLVQFVETAVADFGPATVYTHSAGDLNVDHRRTFDAVLTACRPLPGTTVGVIYAFEVPSSSEWSADAYGGGFRPNRFVDIADHLDTKLRALSCYDEEMRAFPHPRSEQAVRALAAWRGASSGFPAAEAFEIVRERVS